MNSGHQHYTVLEELPAPFRTRGCKLAIALILPPQRHGIAMAARMSSANVGGGGGGGRGFRRRED